VANHLTTKYLNVQELLLRMRQATFDRIRIPFIKSIDRASQEFHASTQTLISLTVKSRPSIEARPSLPRWTPYEYALKWIRNRPIGKPFELWPLDAAVRIYNWFPDEDWRQRARVALSNGRRAGSLSRTAPKDRAGGDGTSVQLRPKSGIL
jgi:hypothetical protein